MTAQLRKLSHDGELGTLQDSLIKDIWSLLVQMIKVLQERLLRDLEMDLAKAIQHGKAAELIRKHANALQYDSNIKTAATISGKNYTPTPSKKSRTEVIKKYKFCSYGHARGSCPALLGALNTFPNTHKVIAS